MLNRFRNGLGVTAPAGDVAESARRTTAHLQTSAARIELRNVTVSSTRLEADVVVENLAGHKLPTTYPSRRAWIHLTVRDAGGAIVFESGALAADGSIAGNDNDEAPER